MDVQSVLKDNGLKITNGRINILEVLENHTEGISADNIYEKCKEKGECFNLSTIYRTLETFEEKGIVNKFDLGDGRYNYIISEKGHKHILQCSLCHKEVEIDCPMTQIEVIIKNKTGFVPIEHELKIRGLCEQCKDNFKDKEKK